MNQGLLAVDPELLRNRVAEICRDVYDVTQPRVTAALGEPIDGQLAEVLGQTIALSAMGTAAYQQLPESPQLRVFIEREIDWHANGMAEQRAIDSGRPILFGAHGEVATAGELPEPSLGDKDAAGPDLPDAWPAGEGVCAVCGCREDAPCEGGCSWVEPGVCSACVPEDLLVQVGVLNDFGGREVALMTGERVLIVELAWPVAQVRRHDKAAASGWGEPVKMFAGSSCVRFTGEPLSPRQF